MSDHFERTKTIKNPIKIHKCRYCGKDITGEHEYVVGSYLGDFYQYRQHKHCDDKAFKMCDKCGFSCDYDGDVVACFAEKIISEENSDENN